MREVLPDLLRSWNAGETVGMGTVVATFRSAPRPPGASMLVGPDGAAVGSVSGRPRPQARPELARGEGDGVLSQARAITPANSSNAARLCPETKTSTDGNAACIPPVSGS